MNDADAKWAPTLAYNLRDSDPSSYLSDVELRLGRRKGAASKPFNVTITLVGQFFADDLVSNTSKRDAVIRSILSPYSEASNSSTLPSGMASFVEDNFITNLTLVDKSKAP